MKRGKRLYSGQTRSFQITSRGLNKLRAAAQANADYSGVPFMLFMDTSGIYRVERDNPNSRHEKEVFNPAKKNPGRRALVPDPHAVRELTLYVDNDADLYRQQFQPILLNLARKMRKGRYDPALAPKLWRYLVDNAARKYAKEFSTAGSERMIFNGATRDVVARELAEREQEKLQGGEYSTWLSSQGIDLVKKNPRVRRSKRRVFFRKRKMTMKGHFYNASAQIGKGVDVRKAKRVMRKIGYRVNPKKRTRFHVFTKYRNGPWSPQMMNLADKSKAISAARYYVKIGGGRVAAKVMKD